MAKTMDKLGKDLNTPAEERRMLGRYKQFQFVFGVATAHELCHAFIGYIRRIYEPEQNTPPGITHLDYRGTVEEAGEITGEAGRWVENKLFGGALELYRDNNDDDDQVSLSACPKKR